MKKHLTISFSKVLLNIVFFMLGVSVFLYVVLILSKGININLFIWLTTCLTYFLIIYHLRKIVSSASSTPFCFDNVKRFRKIGYYMIVASIIDGIVNWKVDSNFELLGTESGSLKGSFLMYLILACIAFVLSEIFEKAVEIKNENDLTI